MSSKYITDFRGEMLNRANSTLFDIKEEPLSPTDERFLGLCGLEDFDQGNNYMRKSMSMSDIASIKEEVNDLKSSENEDILTHSRNRKQSCVAGAYSKTKFMSMAEAIYRYQRDTPERFRSTKPRAFAEHRSSVRLEITRPQSPVLRCKYRARPHHVLSSKEKEELEYEDMKKFHIKANPIPKSVIEGSKNLPNVEVKPLTVPEPFKLSEIHKKAAPAASEHVSNFKARPAPKQILDKPSFIPKRTAPITVPVGSKFQLTSSTDHLKNNLKQDDKNSNKSEKITVRHGPIQPEPFSFEKRDEEMKLKREERRKQQLDEERRRASQFKAQPLPNGVKKRMQCVTNTSTKSSTSSENKENGLAMVKNCHKFVAKPAVVVHKEPFKPVLQSTQMIKPKPFNLATEKRAPEREKFDMLMKQRDEEKEQMFEQRKRMEEEAEEKALHKLRAKLVHKAKPVPPLIAKLPEKSEKLITVPETPKFMRRLKNK